MLKQKIYNNFVHKQSLKNKTYIQLRGIITKTEKKKKCQISKIT